MKFKNWIVLVIGLICGTAFDAIAQQNNDPVPRSVVEFEIELTVDRAKNGVRMKCLEGCRWRTLSFSCDPNGPDCERSFDEGGTPAE